MMKILVSACLLGHNCKYNGGNNYSDQVLAYTKGHEVIPVCPEVMGGLPVPRIPCEIKDGIVINREGLSCDKEFRTGAGMALDIALKEGVDLAILQSRSPSCGVHEIYDGTFSKKLIRGKGIFAQLLEENHIPMVDVERLEEAAKEAGLVMEVFPDKTEPEVTSEVKMDETGIAFLPLRMYMKVTDYTDGKLHVTLKNESGYDMYYGNEYALMRLEKAEENLDIAKESSESSVKSLEKAEENLDIAKESLESTVKSLEKAEENLDIAKESSESTVKSLGKTGESPVKGKKIKSPKRESWITVQPEYEFFWTEEVHLLKDLECVRLTCDLKPYGKLAAGRYKLVKTDLEAEFQIP